MLPKKKYWSGGKFNYCARKKCSRLAIYSKTMANRQRNIFVTNICSSTAWLFSINSFCEYPHISFSIVIFSVALLSSHSEISEANICSSWILIFWLRCNVADQPSSVLSEPWRNALLLFTNYYPYLSSVYFQFELFSAILV